MTAIPLSPSDWKRLVADEAELNLQNRYFETNPTNAVDQVSLLSRPGLKRWLEVGNGPITAIYSQPGSFEDALFVASDTSLYRVDTDETVTLIGPAIFTNGADATPSMCSTANLGTVSEFLFVTDGGSLWVYDGTLPMTEVPTPDGVAICSVAFIASYVIAVPAQGQEMNGRFYWIQPGEVTIDPLDFATAERSPDATLDCRVMGDQIWFFGQNSTEIWYPSGDGDLPFNRIQGKLFDRGVVQGTPIQIKDSIMVIDADGVVYQIAGSPQRVSNNSIEERIRNAIRTMVID